MAVEDDKAVRKGRQGGGRPGGMGAVGEAGRVELLDWLGGGPRGGWAGWSEGNGSRIFGVKNVLE